MKFNSLTQIGVKAGDTLRRFPLPLLCAFAAGLVLINMVDMNEKEEGFITSLHFVLTCSLALPLFTGLVVFCERYYIKTRSVWLLNIFFIIAFSAYFKYLPAAFTQIDIARFCLLFLSVHLAVSFLPYLVNPEVQGFWQYNKSLFLQMLTAVLYSAVLFAGLALAILAIDNLFEVSVHDKTYPRLFIFIATVFNTWFFLSGVPVDIHTLEERLDYPGGLRKFTQFVLLPLVTVYLLILYIYGFKILITMDWPRGWVSYLIIGFSTAGILALLLIWPLRNDSKFTWIKVYTKGFFIALFPLILLFFFSIYIRVREYGITENRYFIIVLAIWLLGNTVYFLLSRIKNIKVIPMSLFFAALFSGYSPWNAFTVSKSDQWHRLHALLLDNDMIRNEKMVAVKDNKMVTTVEQMKMSALVDYLISVHGVGSLQPYVDIDLDSISEKQGRYMVVMKLMEHLNLEYVDVRFQSPGDTGNFQFANEVYGTALDIKGYDVLFKFDFYGKGDNSERKVAFDTSAFVLMDFIEEDNALMLKNKDGSELRIPLREMIRSIANDYALEIFNVPAEKMMLKAGNENFECKLIFRSVYGSLTSEKELKSISSLQVDVLYRSLNQ